MKTSFTGMVGSFDLVWGANGGFVVGIFSEGMNFYLSFVPCGLLFRLFIFSFICLFTKYTSNINQIKEYNSPCQSSVVQKQS